MCANRSHREVSCDKCGTSFCRPPGVSGRLPHYCSNVCKQRDKYEKPDFIVCARCGVERSIVGLPGHVPSYCSQRCWRAEYYPQYRERQQQLERARKERNRTPQPCRRCGRTRPPQNRAFCASCRDVGRKEDISARAKRRRAVEKGASAETFASEEVFDRDGWRCHICGRKCRRDVDSGHRESPTVDHLVPISCNGDHVLANVATAHRQCNVVRNVYGPAQLRLVG